MKLDPDTSKKTWMEIIKPLLRKIEIAMMLETPQHEAVVSFQGRGAMAIHKLLKEMAEKLDRAVGWWNFKPTHRHVVTGVEYQRLEIEFHWEPEWDRKAVLYRNKDGVLIGRFEDVFNTRFEEIKKP